MSGAPFDLTRAVVAQASRALRALEPEKSDELAQRFPLFRELLLSAGDGPTLGPGGEPHFVAALYAEALKAAAGRSQRWLNEMDGQLRRADVWEFAGQILTIIFSTGAIGSALEKAPEWTIASAIATTVASVATALAAFFRKRFGVNLLEAFGKVSKLQAEAPSLSRLLEVWASADNPSPDEGKALIDRAEAVLKELDAIAPYVAELRDERGTAPKQPSEKSSA